METNYNSVCKPINFKHSSIFQNERECITCAVYMKPHSCDKIKTAHEIKWGRIYLVNVTKVMLFLFFIISFCGYLPLYH